MLQSVNGVVLPKPFTQNIGEMTMKHAMLASLIAAVLCSTVFSFAKDEQYQTGKIVDVEESKQFVGDFSVSR